MLAEWTVPFLLTTPKGTLHINWPQGGGGANKNDLYLLDEQKCLAGISALRTTNHDKPQDHGAYLHRIFKSFAVMTLEVEFWKGDIGPGNADPACGADIVRMVDNLMKHLDSLLDPPPLLADQGFTKIQWTPSSGGSDRMLNRIKIIAWPQESHDTPLMGAHLELASPYPYAMDVDEHTTAVGAATTVVNAGTTDFMPVFRVNGPCSQFTIENITSGLSINYDASLPGGQSIASGHYAEISVFGNTIFLDGSGANLMAGLDVATSDFWKLLQGSNDLFFGSDGSATCSMLWNNAWAI